MNVFKKLALIMVSALLTFALLSCGGGGGGGGGFFPSSGGGGGLPSATVVVGRVVDGFVAGAVVTAYQVNANGTPGAQIGTSVQTDQSGNYVLNLGSYTGPVYLTSQGGTYIDAATGMTIDLTNSPLILSSLVPNASGNVTAEINPLTTMAANVALTLIAQGAPVATAASGANASISNYFGLSSNVLSTALLDLTKANCMSGASQQSADASAILAGISQLAKDYGVSPPDLVAALVQDVTTDGLFDGLASGATISVFSSMSGTIPLSMIEGPPPALTGLASAISSFMTNTISSNVCGASVDSSVLSALSTTNIFTTPPAPTGVQAAATYGAAIVSWNTVTGATSYNLYMATSTGVSPASTLLPDFRSITNVTSPMVISTGLKSATYYFVVTAVSGSTPYVGYESAPSAEVSAAITANAQWAQTVTAGSNYSLFNGVAVASLDGSVYAAGYLSGTSAYNFGNSVITSGTSSVYNSALVKYNSSGAAQWAQTTAGSDSSQFMSVAVAPDGSVYAAGYITGTGTYNFGNSVTATGTFIFDNLVLVKYNSSGVAQWAKTVTTGSDYSQFNGVSVAPDGSVYAVGYLMGTGTYTFGNGVTATGTRGGFGFNLVIVKYDSTGLAQWARTVTAGSSDSDFYSVSAASDGSVYAAGFIGGSGTYNFGNGVTAAGAFSNYYNALLVKYDSTGNAQWAQTTTAASDQTIYYSVSAAPDGMSVYAAGYLRGTSNYTWGNSVTSRGSSTHDNVVLVKYNSSGVAQWAQTVTAGSSDSTFYGVSAAPDGSVYAVGYISGTGNYGFSNGVVTAGSTGNFNVVTVKYDNTGLAQYAESVLGGSNDSIYNGVAVGLDGAVYAAGYISGTGIYDFGNSVTATGTNQGANVALVKYNGYGSIGLSW